MKISFSLLFCVLLFGCSFVSEKQRQNDTPINTFLFLPPQWTETISPTATFTKTDTPEATNIPIDITPENTMLYGPRYFETAVIPNFSYFPPWGWNKEVGNPKMQFPTLWITSDYSCLLLFRMNETTMTAKEFLKSLIDASIGMEIISEGSFDNAVGLDAYRMVVQYSSDRMQAMRYAFHKGKYVILSSYLWMTDYHLICDKQVDHTLYTLQFEP